MSRATTYTARLHQRAYTPRRTRRRPSLSQVPALVILIAELGHLAAAMVEWPSSPLRGAFHVVTASLLGAAAVGVYFGQNRSGLVVLTVPCAWLIGSIVGLSPYAHYPLPAAIALTVVEILTPLFKIVDGVRVTKRTRRRP